VLFVDGIIRLDELTMPKRFWREDPAASALPLPLGGSYLTDADLWELQNRMVFFWQRLTLVATLITATAVMAMLVPVWVRPPETVRGWTFGCAVLGVGFAFGYIRWLNVQATKRFNRLVRPVD
jgi:hypothetical protein